MLIRVPIQRIISDIKPRVHSDNQELLDSIRVCGQLEPILVEGPDNDGMYYLIHGYRRLEALRALSKHSLVKCVANGPVTSQEERNKIRFSACSPGKKPTKFEYQQLYEFITDDLTILATLPRHKRHKIEKGREVPEEERLEVAKNRASQEALRIIHSLECDEKFKDDLKSRLNMRKLNTEHAIAIKRLIKNKYYPQLPYKLRSSAIERAIEDGKFTDYKARLITLEVIMENDPKPKLANIWFEYYCEVLRKWLKMIHPRMKDMISDEAKTKIRDLIVEHLGWLWIEYDNATEESSQSQSVPSEVTGNYTLLTSPKNIVSRHKTISVKREASDRPRIEQHGSVIRVLFDEADHLFNKQQP